MPLIWCTKLRTRVEVRTMEIFSTTPWMIIEFPSGCWQSEQPLQNPMLQLIIPQSWKTIVQWSKARPKKWEEEMKQDVKWLEDEQNLWATILLNGMLWDFMNSGSWMTLSNFKATNFKTSFCEQHNGLANKVAKVCFHKLFWLRFDSSVNFLLLK